MELTTKNGFNKMSVEDMRSIEGGFSLAGVVTGFLVGRIVWTPAKIGLENCYYPLGYQGNITI